MQNLSIIIPVYNVAHYLRECLDSVFIVNNFDGEVICINDGSTDESGKILEEYEKKHNNLKIITQENQGQSVARNNGIAIASKEYLYFLDSDDYLLPNAIKTIEGLINSHPNDFLIYIDCAIDSSNQRLITLPCETSIHFDNAIEAYDELNTKYQITPFASLSIYICKKSLYYDFNLKMVAGRYYEDELQIFEYFCHPIPVYCTHISEPWYYYRTNRTDSTTGTTRLKNLVDSMEITRIMYKNMIDFNLATPARKGKIFNMILQTLIMGYESEYKWKWRKWFYNKDKKIMYDCIQNKYDKKLYTLTAIHPILLAAYKCDRLPTIIRKAINRFL